MFSFRMWFHNLIRSVGARVKFREIPIYTNSFIRGVNDLLIIEFFDKTVVFD